MNMQTSFLTPPFGFALFYLRSVAARSDYTDEVTGKRIPAVTTAQIYKGSIAFIVLQLIMVGAIMMFPHIVTGQLGEKVKVDENAISDLLENMPGQEYGAPKNDPFADMQPPPTLEGEEPASTDAAPSADAPAEDDPLKALQDSMKEQKQ